MCIVPFAEGAGAMFFRTANHVVFNKEPTITEFFTVKTNFKRRALFHFFLWTMIVFPATLESVKFFLFAHALTMLKLKVKMKIGIHYINISQNKWNKCTILFVFFAIDASNKNI